MTTLDDFLATLAKARRDEDVVLATMNPGFLWPHVSDSPRDYCYVAPMGSLSPLGLGLALARPDLRIWMIDGDGSLMMNLGSLVTIGGQRPANLVHIVIDNDGYAMTGGQTMPGRGGAQIRELAEAADYREVHEIADPDELSGAEVDLLTTAEGPVLITVRAETGFDMDHVSAIAHSPQGRRTQGPAGYENLRATLAAERP
jgi:sulfopyruvate decarboxylase subunit beta